MHCFEYIKYEIRKNVKSIIERITTKDNILTDDDDLGEEIISEENDKPEKLPKQRLFDIQAECQLWSNLFGYFSETSGPTNFYHVTYISTIKTASYIKRW